MSTTGPNVHQLQLDIQHELITANQLLNSISAEVKFIKNYTSLGGELESTVQNSASLMSTLASLLKIDIENMPSVRGHTEVNHILANQNQTQDSTLRNDSEME